MIRSNVFLIGLVVFLLLISSPAYGQLTKEEADFWLRVTGIPVSEWPLRDDLVFYANVKDRTVTIHNKKTRQDVTYPFDQIPKKYFMLKEIYNKREIRYDSCTMIPCISDGKYGFIDRNGEIIEPFWWPVSEYTLKSHSSSGAYIYVAGQEELCLYSVMYNHLGVARDIQYLNSDRPDLIEKDTRLGRLEDARFRKRAREFELGPIRWRNRPEEEVRYVAEQALPAGYVKNNPEFHADGFDNFSAWVTDRLKKEGVNSISEGHYFYLSAEGFVVAVVPAKEPENPDIEDLFCRTILSSPKWTPGRNSAGNPIAVECHCYVRIGRAY